MEQAVDGIGKRERVSGLHEYTRNTIFNLFACSSGVRGDDSFAHCHTLENHSRKWIGIGSTVYDKIRSSQYLRDVGSITGKYYFVL